VSGGSYKKPDLYSLSLKLVKEIYLVKGRFPQQEKYVLVNQLRNAATLVCSNIAEDAARRSKQEKKRFYEISGSSAVEIDTQFEIALLLEYVKYIQIADIEQTLESVFRMLSKMIDNLTTQTPTSY